MFSAALEVLFPPQCLGCSLPGNALCRACWPFEAPRVLTVGALTVRAAGPYAGPLRRTVLAFKRGRRDAGAALEVFLAARCAASYGERAVFVPVPTSAGRRRARGFDQSVRLARALAAAARRPALLALRRSDGAAQHGLGRAARWRPRERFACAAPELVAGRELVLVDDVVTTGATLLECAGVLIACGAHVGEAVVIAYA